MARRIRYQHHGELGELERVKLQVIVKRRVAGHIVTPLEQERCVARLHPALDERLRDQADPADHERCPDRVGLDGLGATVMALEPGRGGHEYHGYDLPREARRAPVDLLGPLVGAFAPGYIFLFFCGMMVLQLIWVRTMVPETKGVSLEQIQRQLGVEA